MKTLYNTGLGNIMEFGTFGTTGLHKCPWKGIEFLSCALPSELHYLWHNVSERYGN
jgi:hypothetical protein